MGLLDFFNKLRNSKIDIVKSEDYNIDDIDLEQLSKDDIDNLYYTNPNKLKLLLDRDINLFSMFDYPSENLVKYALKKRFDFSSDYLKQHEFSDNVFSVLLDYDPSCMNYYRGNSVELYLKAHDKGYKLTSQNINSIYDFDNFKRLLDIDINYFSYIDYPTIDMVKYAFEKGFDFNEEYLKKQELSENVFSALLDEDPSYMNYYKGNNVNLFLNAIDKGYKLTPQNINSIYDFDNLKKILDKDINYFSYISFPTADMVKYAFEKRFDFSEEYLKKHEFSDNVFSTLVNYDTSYMKYYKGTDVSILCKACGEGYKLSNSQVFMASFSEDFTKILDYDPNYIEVLNHPKVEYLIYAVDKGYNVDSLYINKHVHNSNLLKELFSKYPNLCQYYDGYDMDVYITAMKNGYKIDEKFFNSFNIPYVDMKPLVKIQPDMVRYLYKHVISSDSNLVNYKFLIDILDNNISCKFLDDDYYINYSNDILNIMDLYKIFLDSGVEINDDFFKKYDELCFDPFFMSIIVKYNTEYYKYYKGNNPRVLLEAVRSGYDLSLSEFDKYQNNSFFASEVIKKYPNYYKNYKNKSSDVLLNAIDNGYDASLYELLAFSDDDRVMRSLIDLDPKYIFNYSGSSVELYKYALSKLDGDAHLELLKNSFVTRNNELMKIFIKKNPYNIIYYRGDNIDELVEATSFSKNIPWKDMIYYKFDKKIFMDNFESISNFITNCNINIDDFFKYQLGGKKDWVNEMIKIIENKSFDEFLQVKDYFFDNYYDKTDNSVFIINNFMDILFNYNIFPEFCNSVCDRTLTDKDIRMIKFLFSRNDTKNLGDEIGSLNDLDNIKEILYDSYLSKLIDFRRKYKSFKNLKSREENEIRDFVESLLFNDTNIHKTLGIYGNSEDLKILQFNNRNNPYVCRLIGEMAIYTSIMESISECRDIDKLFNIGINLLENFDFSLECSSFFQSYEEKIRKLFEVDCRENLTRLDCIKNYDSYLDKEKSEKYGVDVLDFSDKSYLLLAHVLSFNETVSDVVLGKSSGKNNYISFSGVSYIKNNLISSGAGAVFGYDDLLEGSFILSSPRNLSTNSYISYNSSEVDAIYRNQKGILETTNSRDFDNSEILAYRAGLKPKCILVTKDREISRFEADIAKRYGLKIVIIQESGKSINNPKKIELKKDYDYFDRDNDIKILSDIKDELNKIVYDDKKAKKRIAVFSDSHGLYEPTLAILEDCRKQGIDEIYSLGDNIGTGPNPDEVLDLLDEYNVKSLKGNHEIYVGDGLDSLKRHLFATGAYEEALNNSEWTRNHISQEHLEKIKLYPEMINLSLGGKKLALVHSVNDYNTNQRIVNVDEFDQVLQGHIHFENSQGNIYTLRGAGIGERNSNKAYYVILSEKENGGFDMETRRVNYNKANLQSDIISSDLNNHDRNKINHWVGR